MTPAEETLKSVQQSLKYASQRVMEAEYEVEEARKREGHFAKDVAYWQHIVDLEKADGSTS